MNKSLFAIVGVVALAALGTTLAGQIQLNSGQSVEFGQGVSLTAACDANAGITLAPSATFINAASGTGTFSLGTIGFSGIDSTCIGKVFTVKAYDNVANSAPLTLVTTGSGSFNYATFTYTTTAPTTPSLRSNGTNLGNFSQGATTGTIDLGWTDTRTISATNTYKFTLESSAN